MKQYALPYHSPLGEILIACDDFGLAGLWFVGQRYYGRTLAEHYESADHPFLRDAMRWLDLYFAGDRPMFVPPLHCEGTVFQQRVWQCLCDIPYGETVTYADIARQIGEERGGRMSAQAVGGAVGRNPVSLIVPCHRVVGSDGSLTGYAGGMERKRWLLALENNREL